jgi:DNA repair exonuclease SbcCD ATPase subunit
MNDTPFYRKELNKLIHEKSVLRNSLKTELGEKKNSEIILNNFLTGQQLLQNVAEKVQNVIYKKIDVVVTKCLTAIFDDPYGFKIIFEQKRNKTEARMVFTKNGYEFDPMEASGGGVVDVAAFALRVASLIISKPKLRRLIVMDEPFKFVSAEYHERCRELLLTLSKEFDIQFIIVTHIKDLVCGKKVNINNF